MNKGRERVCDGCGRKTGLLVIKRRAELCPECYDALCAATQIEIVLVAVPHSPRHPAGFAHESTHTRKENVC